MNASDYTSLGRRDWLRSLAITPILKKVISTDDILRDLSIVNTDSTITVGNHYLELTINRNDGGIRSIRSNQTDVTLRQPVNEAPTTHWVINFETGGPWVDAPSFNAGTPRIQQFEDNERVELRLTWDEIEISSSDSGIVGRFDGNVRSRIILESGSPLLRWQFSVRNEGNRAINSIVCPDINAITPLETDGTDELIVPNRMGRRIRNPIDSDIPVMRYPSGFGTMQFTAYYGKSGGFYSDARDTEGYTKQLSWRHDELGGGTPTLRYEVRHHVPHRPGSGVTVPYPVTLGVFDGDWTDAADRYREWVETEGWLADEEPMVPGWLRDQGVTFQERSYTRESARWVPEPISFEEMGTRIRDLQSQFDVPSGFRWWGWEKHGRPAGGDWLPPYEGREPFISEIESLEDAGIETIGMVGPTFLLDTSDYWGSLDDPSILPIQGQAGEPRTFTDPATRLTFQKVAPTTPHWYDHYQRVINWLLENGVSEIDIDGFPWQWTPNCWNEAHNHPLGRGSNWFPNRMRRELRDIHKRADLDDGMGLGGEGIADFYLPYLNIDIIRDGMGEAINPNLLAEGVDIIPLFKYAFGDYAVTRTQIGLLHNRDGGRNLWRLAAARALEWGSLPMVKVDGVDSFDDDLVKYYSKVGEARSGYANRFLSRGEMLARPDIDRKRIAITGRDVSIETEEIRGRGWQSPEGELGIVLTNVSDSGNSRHIELDLASQPYNLPERPLPYLVSNGVYGSLNGIDIQIEIKPSEVMLIAVKPYSEEARLALASIEEAQSDRPQDSEGLSEAKRAFDARDYDRAQELVENISHGRTPSVEQTPGFTTIAALAGIGSTAAYLIMQSLENDGSG